MDPFAIGTSIGLILDEDDQRKRRTPTPRRSSSLLSLGALIALLALASLLLAGCATDSKPRPARTTTTMTPVYQSPYGPTVYQVDGPDGPQVITVVPGYQSPTGGPRTYHIIEQQP